MSSDFDPSEFVDGDFQSHKSPQGASAAASVPPRAPTREEVDVRVTETQQKLVELKRAQEQLERERSALEETRRRQAEFQTGREEMLQHLTRGLGLLEEAEFNARRDAEQMAKVVLGFREALSRIQGIQETTWTENTFSTELTRALTAVENARMEWNSARLKFPVLAGTMVEKPAEEAAQPAGPLALAGGHSFGEMCRLGFALTWPVALVGLGAAGALIALLLRR